MKKDWLFVPLFVIIIALVSFSLVSSCYPKTVDADENVPDKSRADRIWIGSGVFRVIDEEYGIACYVVSTVNAISCVRLER